MASPAGISAQAGYVSESTPGTLVTVTKFVEIVSETLKADRPRYESHGLRAGRRINHRWAAGVTSVAGDVVMELPNVTLATLLKHMFGTLNTTGAGPYTHTASPGPRLGTSMTWQIGRPDIGGTVRPFTYGGMKFSGWELGANVNEYAILTAHLAGMNEATGTALATASYAAGYSPFTFVQSTLTLAGSSIAVRSFTLEAALPLAADRAGPGSSTVREPLENGWGEFSGTITSDFEDLTAYNRFVNGTEAALVLAFSNGTDSLTITMNVRFDGETPNVGGPDLLELSLPFKATSGTSDAAAITAVLINTDVTA